jgi:iron-sulfur cluster repair protein YtfE (RIC family)
MNMTNVPTEAVERILQEHEALREKVRRIHGVLAQPEPTPNDIADLLREFHTALLVHFSNEENDGFFDEVTTQAPRLTAEAGKLCLEHVQLLGEADELCRFAAAGSPSMAWWRELNSRCHGFSRRLMRHERNENRILQEAHQSDIAAYD